MTSVLFDLDGTLTDPFEGITRCLQHALERLGITPVPPQRELSRFIGPPLRRSFAILLGDSATPADIERAVALFRERFSSVGLFETAIYDTELEGRFDDKADLVAHLVADRALPAAITVMVGDREHDVLAAKKNGLRSIGVTWGYGTPEELRAARADAICDDVEAVLRALE